MSDEVLIRVDKGVPLPWHRYPWDEMEVGDSFFVPDKTPASISSPRLHAERSLGIKTISRAVDGGVRVWRVK